MYALPIANIVLWFFVFDHTNYSTWIRVHLRDMVTLEARHPDVYTEFLAADFTVKRTVHPFSAVAIDQDHEQKAAVKGKGRAVGLTENPSALRWWMVCGPEMFRLIGEVWSEPVQFLTICQLSRDSSITRKNCFPFLPLKQF